MIRKEKSYEEIEKIVSDTTLTNQLKEEILISKLDPLIIKKCRHYFGFCDEDLLQMGRLKLLELIRNFDKNRKEIIFLGYVSKFLGFYFLDLKRQELQNKEKIAFIKIDEIENIASYDEKSFSKILISESLKTLNKDEKHLIQRHILSSATLKELAKEMGKTHEQVKYLKKKTIGKIKKCLY